MNTIDNAICNAVVYRENSLVKKKIIKLHNKKYIRLRVRKKNKARRSQFAIVFRACTMSVILLAQSLTRFSCVFARNVFLRKHSICATHGIVRSNIFHLLG